MISSVSIPGLEVHAQIGRGGFATVFRARQAQFERDVAVKVIDADVSDPSRLDSFLRECAVIGRLTGHPNVVPVVANGILGDGRPYLVMEYQSGGTIARRLANGERIELWESVSTAVKIAGALESVHRHGSLHSDVKPQNILIGRSGEPTLSDFGLASLAITDVSRSRQALTPAHAAPEAFDGVLIVQSDVYSLASTLYTMLTGAPPFGDESQGLLRLVHRIATEEPPELDLEGAPRGLVELLKESLSRDPKMRPQSALEFAEALCSVEEAAGRRVTPIIVLEPEADDLPIGFNPVASPTVPPAVTVEPEPRSRRRMLVGMSVLALALVVGGVVALVSNRDSRDVPAVTQVRSATSLKTTTTVPSRHGVTEVQYLTIPSRDKSPAIEAALDRFLSGVDPNLAPNATHVIRPLADVAQTPASVSMYFTNLDRDRLCLSYAATEIEIDGARVSGWAATNGRAGSLQILQFATEEDSKKAFLGYSLDFGAIGSQCVGFQTSGADRVVRNDLSVAVAGADEANSWYKTGNGRIDRQFLVRMGRRVLGGNISSVEGDIVSDTALNEYLRQGVAAMASVPSS